MCKMYCLQVYLMFKKHQFQRDCVNFQKRKKKNQTITQSARELNRLAKEEVFVAWKISTLYENPFELIDNLLWVNGSIRRCACVQVSSIHY